MILAEINFTEVSLLEISAMGAVMIGLVILLRRAAGTKLPPGCYLALWALVGVRLLLPVKIATPFSVYNLLTEKSLPMTNNVNHEPLWLNFDMQAVIMQNHSQVSGVLFSDWVLIIWFIGAICCFIYLLSSHWRCRRWYAVSVPVEQKFVQTWKKDHLLKRKYQIRKSQLVHTPLTYGLFHPVILLPASQNMSDDEWNLVLLHEWNHIRHLDVLWQWILVIICSIHWFNPSVWVMYVFCRQDLELFCDAATVRQLGDGENRMYALLLLQQAAQVKETTPVFSSSRFTGYQCMEERIQTIMKPKKFTWKLAIVTAVLFCVGGAAFATTSIGGGSVNEMDIDLPVQSQNTGTMAAQEQENEQLIWPVVLDDADVTLLYGVRKHPVTGEEMKIDHISIGGEDAEGSAVMAAASGIVKEVGYDAQRGNYLLIQHDNGLETCSWHCETLLVEEGDIVSANQTIATLGRTGDATGPCLSFAVYQDGEAVDPMDYFNAVESIKE